VEVIMFLASILWLLVGCGDPGPCFFEDPSGYVSIDKLECGLSADTGGEALCNWTLSFIDGEFSWGHSDVLETGPYTCEGDTVTGTADGATYTGTWDEATGTLTWEGVAYQ